MYSCWLGINVLLLSHVVRGWWWTRAPIGTAGIVAPGPCVRICRHVTANVRRSVGIWPSTASYTIASGLRLRWAACSVRGTTNAATTLLSAIWWHGTTARPIIIVSSSSNIIATRILIAVSTRTVILILKIAFVIPKIHAGVSIVLLLLRVVRSTARWWPTPATDTA